MDTAPTQPPTGTRWIVSPGFDGVFFIGGFLLTFAFYGLWRGVNALGEPLGFVLRGDSILITYFLFTAFFDHPHIFQTFSRTHRDPDERRRGPFAYRWGLVLLIAAGFAAQGLGFERELIVFAALFGSWHVIRQHAGFLKIYKRINGDTAPVDNWLDGAFFYVGMFACMLHNYVDLHGPTLVYGSLSAQFPRVPEPIGEGARLLFKALLVAYVARQLWRFATGRPLNLPKLLLLAAALSSHWFIFLLTTTPFLVAESLETAWHTLQYQGLMQRYQSQRFRIVGLARRWLLVALAYGLVAGGIEMMSLIHRGLWTWLFTPFACLVLFHYWVDGRIWKQGRAPELRGLFAGAA